MTKVFTPWMPIYKKALQKGETQMKLEEAIETQETYLKGEDAVEHSKLIASMELGIEALKRTIKRRETLSRLYEPLLPGETPVQDKAPDTPSKEALAL